LVWAALLQPMFFSHPMFFVYFVRSFSASFIAQNNLAAT